MHEEGHYCKSVRVSKFWSNNCTEYENNGDRNKTVSAEESLNKIIPYLKDIINSIETSNTKKHNDSN